MSPQKFHLEQQAPNWVWPAQVLDAPHSPCDDTVRDPLVPVPDDAGAEAVAVAEPAAAPPAAAEDTGRVENPELAATEDATGAATAAEEAVEPPLAAGDAEGADDPLAAGADAEVPLPELDPDDGPPMPLTATQVPEMVPVAPAVPVRSGPGSGKAKSVPSTEWQPLGSTLATKRPGREEKAVSRSAMVRFAEAAPMVTDAQFMYISRLPTLLYQVHANKADPVFASEGMVKSKF